MRYSKNFERRTMRPSVVQFALFLLELTVIDAAYKIGVGRADSTGPAAEVVFMGYAKMAQKGEGIHLRLYTRAFIIEDEQNTRIAFVNVDGAMISDSLKREVLKRLRATVGDVYNEKNLILSATHTHSGPGGFMGYLLFDFSCYGFVKETFDAFASGITRAILRAHNSLVPGRIFLSTGEVLDANINRSPHSYVANPENERAKYKYNVDKELVQLKFTDVDGHLLGAINWFAVHPTSMNNTNRLISSDNIGYASILLEKEFNPGSLPGQGEFVGAFASTNLGDVSPNLKGPHCLDTGESCDNVQSSCNGRSQMCVSFGPGESMFQSTSIIANRIYNQASDLLRNSNGEEIVGSIKFDHQYVNMPAQSIESTTEDGEHVRLKGCNPAMGYSFAAGTTDGPGEFSFEQATKKESRTWNTVRALLSAPTPEDIQCHQPKAILFNTGKITYPYRWQPSVVPIQMALFGKMAIVAVPGEFTTMAGRRLRAAVGATIANNGGAVDNRVIIAGLSNTYSDYITTPEEYEIQRYEGASTIYGPHTLPIYIHLYQEMAKRLLQGTSRNILIDAAPHIFALQNLISLTLPVLFDTSGNHHFGDCIQQPENNVKPGDTVQVEFVTANPRNNWLQEKTFLTVERQVEYDWIVVATDSSWETIFKWKRAHKFVSTSQAVIEWTVPLDVIAGVYRIRHFGTSKSIWGVFKEFKGATKPFNVRLY